MLAGHVELVSGEPMALEETYELRRAFVVERRRRQSERREGVGVDRQRRAEQKERRVRERAEDIDLTRAPVMPELEEAGGRVKGGGNGAVEPAV